MIIYLWLIVSPLWASTWDCPPPSPLTHYLGLSPLVGLPHFKYIHLDYLLGDFVVYCGVKPFQLVVDEYL